MQKKSLLFHNKVDIIIPTYNRPDFLKRILGYYQIYGRNLKFIIADSSSPVNKSRNKKIIDSYSKLNILYMDKFSPNLSQHHKFAEVIQYARSKYVCFCADDDFIVPNGIKEAVDFLEKNPDYSAAHGTYISFHVYKTLFGIKKFWWRFLYSPHSISSPNPLNRLKHHLTNYTLVAWAVQRTSIAKIYHNEFLKCKIDPYLLPVFGELLPDALTVIYGKIKHLNTLYGARQAFSQISSSYPSLKDAKNTGIYDLEYGKFKNCLLNNLTKVNNNSREKSSEIIDNTMEKYIKYSYQEHLVNKLNRILKHFPDFLQKEFKLLHAIYLFSKDKKNRIGLIDNPSSKYFNHFNSIRQIVLEDNQRY